MLALSLSLRETTIERDPLLLLPIGNSVRRLDLSLGPRREWRERRERREEKAERERKGKVYARMHGGGGTIQTMRVVA